MDLITGDCWMYDWIDEYEITSPTDARRALKSPQGISRLFDIAFEASKPDESRDYAGQSMLIAGQGVNLSGETTCINFKCVRQEIDYIISKAWHYFEKVVVAGPSPRNVALDIGDTPKKARDYMYWTLENEIKTLLYIREIGATSWLEFVPNTNIHHCDPCTRKLAEDKGFDAAFDEEIERQVVTQLEQEARIDIGRQDGLWNATVDHEFLAEPMAYKFQKRPSRLDVSQRIYDSHHSATVKDFVKSDMLKLPLAAVAQANWLMRASDPQHDSIEDRMGRVALQLELPVIEGLPGRELLQLIEDEREHFASFRGALRSAIAENISRLDSKSDSEIAIAVRREYIEPELAKIDSRLKSAKKSLTKKAVAGVAVGTLVTSVGLLAAMPLVIATGVAAAATPLPQVYKYFDDSSSVEISDMYFLWRIRRDWRRS